MTVIAYIDESGSKNDKTVLCLGGLLSTERQWSELEREWNVALLDSPMPRYGDGRPHPFHMTDFEANAGCFQRQRGWDDKSKNELLNRLLGIMLRRVKMRSYAMLSLSDYRAQLSHADGKLKYAYSFLALGICSIVSHWARLKSHPERIPYVFERAKKVGQGRAMQAIDDLATTDKANLLQIGPTVADRKDLPPLQAADIWAWEVRRYFHRQYLGQSAYGIRKSLARLLEIPDGEGFVIAGQELRDIVLLWKEALASGRAGPHELPIAPQEFSLRSRPQIILESSLK